MRDPTKTIIEPRTPLPENWQSLIKPAPPPPQTLKQRRHARGRRPQITGEDIVRAAAAFAAKEIKP